MSIKKKVSPRDSILYKAFDLFRAHRSITCATCGHQMRSKDGEKKAQVVRGEIISIFREHVPPEDRLVTGQVFDTCQEFRRNLVDYAHHALDQDGAKFIDKRMSAFLRGLDGDRQESR